VRRRLAAPQAVPLELGYALGVGLPEPLCDIFNWARGQTSGEAQF
jgi:hypothetical protein